MTNNILTFLVEPKGNIYRELLVYALSECKYFSFVTNKNKELFSSTEKKVLEELIPYLVRLEMRSEWPGTILLKGEALVYTYIFVQESAKILKNSATGLYQWQEPHLPDDLCFLRSDESPWLVTTAHESDSYFMLSDHEVYRLLEALPSLIPILKKEVHDKCS